MKCASVGPGPPNEPRPYGRGSLLPQGYALLGEAPSTENDHLPADSSTPHRRRRSKTTDATRAQRNQAIIARRASGAKWAEIAAEFGLSASRVRAIVRDHREANAAVAAIEPVPVSDIDPDAVLAAVVETHQWAAGHPRQLAERADNDSAKVGAAKGAAAVGRDLVTLLLATGIAPQARDWTTLREVRAVARALWYATAAEFGPERADALVGALPKRQPLLPEIRLDLERSA